MTKWGKWASALPPHGHSWSHSPPASFARPSASSTVSFKLVVRTEMGFLESFPLFRLTLCSSSCAGSRNCLNLACLGLFLPFWFPHRPRLFVLLPSHVLYFTSAQHLPFLCYCQRAEQRRAAGAVANGWPVTIHGAC